jgi:hypothetical protein
MEAAQRRPGFSSFWLPLSINGEPTIIQGLSASIAKRSAGARLFLEGCPRSRHQGSDNSYRDVRKVGSCIEEGVDVNFP